MRQPSVLFGVRGPTVGAIEQQGGAGDRRPQRLYVRLRQVEDGPDVQIIVELPAPAAVLVAIDALHGQMTRLFGGQIAILRSEEHTSELQSLMRISYAVFCLKKKKRQVTYNKTTQENFSKKQTSHKK